jgi:hypothetical protein
LLNHQAQIPSLYPFFTIQHSFSVLGSKDRSNTTAPNVGGHDLRDVQSLIFGLSDLGPADVDGHGQGARARLPHDGDKPQGLKNWLVTFDTLKCP